MPDDSVVGDLIRSSTGGAGAGVGGFVRAGEAVLASGEPSPGDEMDLSLSFLFFSFFLDLVSLDVVASGSGAGVVLVAPGAGVTGFGEFWVGKGETADVGVGAMRLYA